MVIFHSYVKLPEGKLGKKMPGILFKHLLWCAWIQSLVRRKLRKLWRMRERIPSWPRSASVFFWGAETRVWVWVEQIGNPWALGPKFVPADETIHFFGRKMIQSQMNSLNMLDPGGLGAAGPLDMRFSIPVVPTLAVLGRNCVWGLLKQVASSCNFWDHQSGLSLSRFAVQLQWQAAWSMFSDRGDWQLVRS